MRVKSVVLLLVALVSVVAWGQSVNVVDFAKMSKKEAHAGSFRPDGKESLLVLYSSGQGFRFERDGKLVDAEQRDGMFLLRLPAGTSSLVVSHDEFGTCQWKIPYPGIKKKHVYRATLHASGQEEYKVDKQWLVLRLNPSRCMVTVDSTVHFVDKGLLSLQLPLGEHCLTVESPFYDTVTDSVTLNDSLRVEKTIELPPRFAYLTVDTDVPEADIRLDGRLIGKGTVSTNRIAPGHYVLSLNVDDKEVYCKDILVGNTSRTTVHVGREDLNSVKVSADVGSLTHSSLVILAPDSLSSIWVNREKMGEGRWEGMLDAGLYGLNCMKDSLETPLIYVRLQPGERKVIQLPSPYDFYGALDVSSNVEGAAIYINGKWMGETPCISQHVAVAG